MQGVHLRKYGVETIIDFELYDIDGVDCQHGAVDGGTDCNVAQDEAAFSVATNDFVDRGFGYSLTLTAGEMEGARIIVFIIDSAVKVYLDKVIVIETYGNASAQHALDLDDAVRGGMTALPAAAADAAGGLPISDDGGLDMDAILEKMLAYIQLLTRSDAAIETDNSTELTEINADGGSGAGNYSSQTDSHESIKDTGGGDATAANQTTIINHMTDVKGTGFAKDTDSLVDLAHIGADGDTLETLSDQIDAGVSNQPRIED